jgi:hypothetical protein
MAYPAVPWSMLSESNFGAFPEQAKNEADAVMTAVYGNAGFHTIT